MGRLDRKKTLDLIERMKLARIGKYSEWESLIRRLGRGGELNAEEIRHLSSLARIYKDTGVSSRSKIFHVRLSEHDKKPPCISCGDESLFYCNMNDSYYCTAHVVGHDENEL